MNTTTQNESTSFVGTTLSLGLRFASLGALVWFGLLVASSTGAIQGLNPASETLADQKVNAIHDQIFHPAEGYWTIAGAQLSIQQIRCERKLVDQRMAELSQVEPCNESSNHLASELIAVAKSAGAKRLRCSAGNVWTIDNSSLIVRLVTTEERTPKLLAALFAIQDGQQWQLTTLEPRMKTSQDLLPLFADTQTTCTRQSDQGQLQMQLVVASQTDAQWLQLWKSRGWQMQHTDWGNDEAFSYLCEREGDVVYAWSDGLAGERTLMLTAATATRVDDTHKQ